MVPKFRTKMSPKYGTFLNSRNGPISWAKTALLILQCSCCHLSLILSLLLPAGRISCGSGYLSSDKAFLFSFTNRKGEVTKMELRDYERHRAMHCLESNSTRLVFGDGDITLINKKSSNDWVVFTTLPVSYTSPVDSGGASFLFNTSSANVSDVEVLFIGGKIVVQLG